MKTKDPQMPGLIIVALLALANVHGRKEKRQAAIKRVIR